MRFIARLLFIFNAITTSKIYAANKCSLVSEAPLQKISVEDRCAAAGTQSTSGDQADFLNQIRKKSIERISVLSKNLTEAQKAEAKRQVPQLRSLMALRQVDLEFEDDQNKVKTGNFNLQFVLPEKIYHAPGFTKNVPDLDAEEMKKALSGLEVRRNSLKEAAKNIVLSQTKTLTRLGINPLVPVAAELGSQRDLAIKSVQEMAEIGYQDLISKDPWLLFVDKKSPTDQDLENAHRKYVESLAIETTRLTKLQTDPFEDSALALLFYGSSVSTVLDSDPKFCSAFNALKMELRSREKFRQIASFAFGVGAGGACLAAAFVSGGILGAGCLALTAGEAGVAGTAAIDSYQEAKMLYGGVLQGGDFEKYQAKRNEVSSYMLAAGLSSVGLAGQTLHAVTPLVRPRSPMMLPGESATAFASRRGAERLRNITNEKGEIPNFPQEGQLRAAQAATDAEIAELATAGSKFEKVGSAPREVRFGNQKSYEASLKGLADAEASLAKAKADPRPNPQLISAYEKNVDIWKKNIELARPGVRTETKAADTYMGGALIRRILAEKGMPPKLHDEMMEVSTYKVVEAGPASRVYGPNTSFMRHPQFSRDLKRLKEMGVEVHVDPTLRLSDGTLAAYNSLTKKIHVAPNTSYQVFRHEVQHADFSAIVTPKLALAREQVAAGKSLADIFSAEEKAKMGVGQLQRIEELLKRGHTNLGIDETLATDVQIGLLGYRRYIGSNMNAEAYQMFHQYKSYMDIAKKNPNGLSPEQLADVKSIENRFGEIALMVMGQKEASLRVRALASSPGVLSANSLTAMSEIMAASEKTPNAQVLYNDQGGVIIYRNGEFIRIP